MKRDKLDPLTAATVTVAWVIIANKPFYPFYVWWLIGRGVGMSATTLVPLPFFLAIPLLARKSPFSARLALPLVGTLDTVFETIVFGRASATLLFLAPCMTLAIISFGATEKWWQRGMVCLVFACFAICWSTIRGPTFPWSSDELATFLNINILAVASLMTFIGIRYAGMTTDVSSRGFLG